MTDVEISRFILEKRCVTCAFLRSLILKQRHAVLETQCDFLEFNHKLLEFKEELYKVLS